MAEQISKEKTERNNKLRKAYSNATTRLREAHRDEFDSLYSQCAEELGVTWTPKPSPERKAEQDMDALLEKYPHLRERVLAESAENPSEPDRDEGDEPDLDFGDDEPDTQEQPESEPTRL